MFKWVISGIFFLTAMSACSSKPTDDANSALAQADLINDDFILFHAKPVKNATCVILYPGGLVYSEAYSPLAQAIAKQGYSTFLLKVTLDLAILEVDAADKAKTHSFAQQNCSRFLVGGHSLGGTMAVDYVSQHPNDGLLALAAYPQESSDMSGHDNPALVISGSNDELASPEEMTDARKRLPKHTVFIEISGANHAQFGSYGPQKGDGIADISSAKQQATVVQHVVKFIQQSMDGT